MDDPNGKQPSDLLFAWLSPIETHVDQKMQRPKSPSLGLALGSPLVRAKTAAITGFKRTFSGGQSRQDYRQRGGQRAGNAVADTVTGDLS